jgi:hypothetical protein
MDRILLPPETFFEGTPPHVRAYIEQLHSTIADLHLRIAELQSKQVKNSTNSSLPPSSERIRSRAEGDKRIVPENHGERQEGRHLVGTAGKRPGGIFSPGFSHLFAANISASRTRPVAALQNELSCWQHSPSSLSDRHWKPPVQVGYQRRTVGIGDRWPNSGKVKAPHFSLALQILEKSANRTSDLFGAASAYGSRNI